MYNVYLQYMMEEGSIMYSTREAAGVQLCGVGWAHRFFLASSEKPERFKKKKDRVVIGGGLMSGSERARSLICRWQALSREKVQCAAGASWRVSLTGEAGSQPRRRWIDLDLGNSNCQSFEVYQFSLGSWRLRRNRGCFRGSLVVPSKRRREWWVLVYFELQNIL